MALPDQVSEPAWKHHHLGQSTPTHPFPDGLLAVFSSWPERKTSTKGLLTALARRSSPRFIFDAQQHGRSIDNNIDALPFSREYLSFNPDHIANPDPRHPNRATQFVQKESFLAMSPKRVEEIAGHSA